MRDDWRCCGCRMLGEGVDSRCPNGPVHGQSSTCSRVACSLVSSFRRDGLRKHCQWRGGDDSYLAAVEKVDVCCGWRMMIVPLMTLPHATRAASRVLLHRRERLGGSAGDARAGCRLHASTSGRIFTCSSDTARGTSHPINYTLFLSSSTRLHTNHVLPFRFSTFTTVT